jgi:hypothetical protein
MNRFNLIDTYAAKFFLVTFILSWGAWGPRKLVSPDALDPSSPSYLLLILGGFGLTSLN